jgi:cytochrome c oxidase subunit 3
VALESHAIADHHEHPAYLHHHFDDVEQQREVTSLGMWLFLCTEVMMFGGLFFSYTLYRLLYTPAWHAGSQHLNITLGTINTFVLLASSWTMAMAVHCAQVENKRWMCRWLAITWLFGAAFIGIKAVEWTADYKEGIMPAVSWHYYDEPEHAHQVQELAEQNLSPRHVMLYFVLYFCMTGLHAIHMLIGLGLVGWFIYLGSKGQFLGGNDQPVEIMGLYWHLVDIIWIFLFPLLYLIAGFHPWSVVH